MEEKKKFNFFRKFFPFKGDPVGTIVRKIVLIVSVIVFIVSAFVLVDFLVIQPKKNESSYDDIKEIYHNINNNIEAGADPYKVRADRLNSVRTLNSDIVGWINIPNTQIDYPVLMPPEGDDSYYLYRNYKKEDTKYGSLFIDHTVNLENNHKNIVIHGHHMRDGSMFANLMKFSDLEFYKQNPIVKFDTINGVADWKIISIFKINIRSDQGELFEYVQTGFADDTDFLNYVYNIRERSLIDIPVDLNENDEIVTLSTCSYEFDDFRTVVVARKVRDGESTEVDVANAKSNPDPLMPQIWYDKRWGSKPNVTDFNTAYKNGEISWYLEPEKKPEESADEEKSSEETSEEKQSEEASSDEQKKTEETSSEEQ